MSVNITSVMQTNLHVKMESMGMPVNVYLDGQVSVNTTVVIVMAHACTSYKIC